VAFVTALLVCQMNCRSLDVRDEFSTWDWVMSGMLERAGFRIEQSLNTMPQMREYICSKTEE